MKKKLSLGQLEVRSFKTDAGKIKGGEIPSQVTCPICHQGNSIIVCD